MPNGLTKLAAGLEELGPFKGPLPSHEPNIEGGSLKVVQGLGQASSPAQQIKHTLMENKTRILTAIETSKNLNDKKIGKVVEECLSEIQKGRVEIQKSGFTKTEELEINKELDGIEQVIDTVKCLTNVYEEPFMSDHESKKSSHGGKRQIGVVDAELAELEEGKENKM